MSGFRKAVRFAVDYDEAESEKACSKSMDLVTNYHEDDSDDDLLSNDDEEDPLPSLTSTTSSTPSTPSTPTLTPYAPLSKKVYEVETNLPDALSFWSGKKPLVISEGNHVSQISFV